MMGPVWTPARRQMVAAVGETFLPPMHPGDWHGGDATSVAITENFIRLASWQLRAVFWVCMWALELTPIFVVGKLARFSRMPGAERLRMMRIYSRKMPFAILFAPLRPLLAVPIYSRPDAMASTGYNNQGRSAA